MDCDFVVDEYGKQTQTTERMSEDLETAAGDRTAGRANSTASANKLCDVGETFLSHTSRMQ